jgi:hypothetical protein
LCNLYSVTKGQQAIRELAGAMRDRTGNLPPLPGIFPDYAAAIVRNHPDGPGADDGALGHAVSGVRSKGEETGHFATIPKLPKDKYQIRSRFGHLTLHVCYGVIKTFARSEERPGTRP